MASISGLGSGLDINSLVTQLMAIERRSQDQLVARRQTASDALSAWKSIKSKFTDLKTATLAMAKPSDWQAIKATTSDADAVAVSGTTSSTTGSLSFTVAALATAAARRSAGTVSSLSAKVADGAITLTKTGGAAETIDVGDGTLQSVVNAINAANKGVTAAAVLVAPGQYRLQVTAAETGTASQFTLDLGGSSALGTMEELAAGSDAQLVVGEGPGSYTITSGTNKIEGLLPGLTVTLQKTTTTPVTVGVARDAEGLADKIQAFVDKANAILGDIKIKTVFTKETNSASPLTGDSTVRRLASDLLMAVSAGIDPGNQLSAGMLGLSVTKEGSLSFDRAKFTKAYEANAATVVDTMSQRGVSSSGTVQFLSTGFDSAPGTYDVVVTQAATQASELGLVGAWPATGSTALRVKVGATEVGYTIEAGMTAADVAAELNSRFAANKLGLVAAAEGDGLAIRAVNYGSSGNFEISYDDGGTWAARTGTDVAGTIGGIAATGAGQLLTISPTSAELPGFTVRVSATPADVTGPTTLATIEYQPGVAQRMLRLIDEATDTIEGTLVQAEKGVQSRIDDLDDQIAAWDRRLAIREQRLRLQFATLDTTLGALRNQSQWLTSQLSSLGSF